jgi:hypothetical protein
MYAAYLLCVCHSVCATLSLTLRLMIVVMVMIMIRLTMTVMTRAYKRPQPDRFCTCHPRFCRRMSLCSWTSRYRNKHKANCHRLENVLADDKIDGSTCSLMLLLISWSSYRHHSFKWTHCGGFYFNWVLFSSQKHNYQFPKLEGSMLGLMNAPQWLQASLV